MSGSITLAIAIDSNHLPSHDDRQVAGLEREEVRALAAGEGHALALAADGQRVWAWGCGSSGQLGVGRPRRTKGAEEAEAAEGDVGSCRPLALPLDPSMLGSGDDGGVEQVGVGKRHSLLLTRRGQVLSFGSGLYHALGHGGMENEWAPRVVEALEGLGEMRAGACVRV